MSDEFLINEYDFDMIVHARTAKKNMPRKNSRTNYLDRAKSVNISIFLNILNHNNVAVIITREEGKILSSKYYLCSDIISVPTFNANENAMGGKKE